MSDFCHQRDLVFRGVPPHGLTAAQARGAPSSPRRRNRVDRSASALAQLGWDERRTAELAELGHDPSAAARVVRVDRGNATLRAAGGDLRVATDRLDVAPAVGDWLVADGDGAVAALLERRSLLERRMPDDSTSSPVVAANVDIVVVANALDHAFSARRLERFLLVAVGERRDAARRPHQGRRLPRPRAAVAEAEAGRPRRAGAGAERAARGRASTSCARGSRARRPCCIGRSGAGKSTLVNALAGDDVAATAEVRRDGKGRHTTTHRELHPLAGGGVLIDTPGLRAVFPHDPGAAAESAFGDVEELAAGCRFGDCGHAGEPGCAVAARRAAGELTRERFEAWQRAERDRTPSSGAATPPRRAPSGGVTGRRTARCATRASGAGS